MWWWSGVCWCSGGIQPKERCQYRKVFTSIMSRWTTTPPFPSMTFFWLPLPSAPFSHPLPLVFLHTALLSASPMAELYGTISGSFSPLCSCFTQHCFPGWLPAGLAQLLPAPGKTLRPFFLALPQVAVEVKARPRLRKSGGWLHWKQCV